MNSSLIGLAVFSLLVSSASAGVLIFEGNDDRNEPPYPLNGGKAVIDVYAQGLFDVAAIQSGFNFLQNGNNFNSLFQISKDEGNPDYAAFGYQMIDLGPSIPLLIFPIYTNDRDTAGFMLLTGSIEFPTKTLLYSVTYDYTADAIGTYAIDVNPDLTVLGDPMGSPIFYDIILGSMTVPEPTTIVLLSFGLICLFSHSRRKLTN